MFTDNLVIRRTHLRNLKIEAWNELQDVCFAIADFQLTILTRGLKTTDGATPDATVGAQITASIKHDGIASPFIKVGKGTFALRSKLPQPDIEPLPDGADEVIRATQRS